MKSNLIGMSFSWAKGRGTTCRRRGPTASRTWRPRTVLAAVKPILEDAVQKVGHNIKYDLLVMRKVGIDVRGVALDSA